MLSLAASGCGLCHNFISEVFCFLLDTFTHFEAIEAIQGYATAAQQLSDGGVWIFNECLTNQSNLCQVLTHTTFNHLLDNVSWLTALLSLSHNDITLFLK